MLMFSYYEDIADKDVRNNHKASGDKIGRDKIPRRIISTFGLSLNISIKSDSVLQW